MTAAGELGKRGETWARDYFLKHHYEILEQNWTFDRAELDLIVYQDQTLIFVEVKTRSGVAFGTPEEFVDAAKQKHLQRAAEEYIRLMNHQGEVRFDICAILVDEAQNPTIKHIIDAFWPE
ncbi:MAG: YraN family protein [Sphingobacteriaceae bacterium]